MSVLKTCSCQEIFPFLLGRHIYWHELFVLPIILISVRPLVTSLLAIDNLVFFFPFFLIYLFIYFALLI